MDAKLAKIYYGPGCYWKGIAAIKKLAEAAKVPEDAATHQADLLFLPHDKLSRGRKVYKYALTVVDVASRYKETEPLTSKNSDEVAQAFQKIYKR